MQPGLCAICEVIDYRPAVGLLSMVKCTIEGVHSRPTHIHTRSIVPCRHLERQTVFHGTEVQAH